MNDLELTYGGFHVVEPGQTLIKTQRKTLKCFRCGVTDIDTFCSHVDNPAHVFCKSCFYIVFAEHINNE